MCSPHHSAAVPEVSLPNFFMPPEELERAMRSLRAAALARPPPRKLFYADHTHSHHPQEKAARNPTCGDLDGGGDQRLRGRGGGDIAGRLVSCSPQSVRTAQDVDQFLRSRRASGRAGDTQPQTLSDRDAQRLSRIFASKPLQTTN